MRCPPATCEPANRSGGRGGGELERLRPPRLHAEAVPDARDGGVRDRCALAGQRRGQQPGGPVRRAEPIRRLGQRQLQHPLPQRLRRLRQLARPRQILQPGQALLGVATPLGHHRSLGAADDRRDFLAGHLSRGQQHDPGLLNHPGRRHPCPRPGAPARRSASGTSTVRTCAGIGNRRPRAVIKSRSTVTEHWLDGAHLVWPVQTAVALVGALSPPPSAGASWPPLPLEQAVFGKTAALIASAFRHRLVPSGRSRAVTASMTPPWRKAALMNL